MRVKGLKRCDRLKRGFDGSPFSISDEGKKRIINWIKNSKEFSVVDDEYGKEI